MNLYALHKPKKETNEKYKALSIILKREKIKIILNHYQYIQLYFSTLNGLKQVKISNTTGKLKRYNKIGNEKQREM